MYLAAFFVLAIFWAIGVGIFGIASSLFHILVFLAIVALAVHIHRSGKSQDPEKLIP